MTHMVCKELENKKNHMYNDIMQPSCFYSASLLFIIIKCLVESRSYYNGGK